MQTRLQSIIEVATNVTIGYLVAVLSQIIIFPYFGIFIPIVDNFLIGLWFTFISVLRGYLVRRYYNHKLITKKE